MPQGTLYIISAPSGGGKTTLTKELLAKNTKVEVSVSYTTRPPRPEEKNGVHYHFVDDETFNKKLAEGAFLEHANVFGKQYGTCREAVLDKLKSGINVILVIDWQGAQQMRKSFPSAVSIFIVPPSLAVLRERLTTRAQDAQAVIDRRLQGAIEEIRHYVEYDHLVINDQFDKALADLEAIICLKSEAFVLAKQAEKHRDLLASLFC
jgi:guanylate kinase